MSGAPPPMSPGVWAHVRRIRIAAMLMAGFLLGLAVMLATNMQWCGGQPPDAPQAQPK